MKLSYINLNKYFNVKEVLKAEFSMSDRLLLKLKKLDKIYLNGKVTSVNHSIVENDLIECHLDYDEDNSNIVPTKIPINIIYEDEAYLVVNKPAGIPVHPSMDHYTDSLANGVIFYFNQIGLKKKIRPVNRLDKDTSGIVIFAKNEYICHNLNILKKEYLAIVNGKLEGHDIIDMRIGGKNADGIKRLIDEKNGKEAITEYYNLKNLKMNDRDITLIKCIIHTGRTHQIRLHMSSISHDILGDKLYGKETSNINRLMLHAYKVTFYHPIKNKKIVVKSLLPENMMKIIKYE